MELIMVIIIIGLMSTVIVNYLPYKEKAINKEAISALKMIDAAERIYKLETGNYVEIIDNADANTKLKLYLPTGETNWSYSVSVDADGKAFISATRTSGSDIRTWKLEVGSDAEPCCDGRYCDGAPACSE